MRREAAGYNETPRESLGWLEVMWEAAMGRSTPVHMEILEGCRLARRRESSSAADRVRQSYICRFLRTSTPSIATRGLSFAGTMVRDGGLALVQPILVTMSWPAEWELHVQREQPVATALGRPGYTLATLENLVMRHCTDGDIKPLRSKRQCDPRRVAATTRISTSGQQADWPELRPSRPSWISRLRYLEGSQPTDTPLPNTA